MMRLVASLLAIARTTFTETLRAPVFGVGLAAGTALTATAPAFAFFALGREKAFGLDLAASSGTFTLLFLAAVAAGTGTSERLRGGTASLVLAGPTGRGSYVLGSWLGAAAALAVAGWILGLALIFAAGQACGRRGWGLELGAAAAAVAAAAWASRAGRAPGPWAWATLSLAGALAIGTRLGFERAPSGSLEGLAAVQAAVAVLGAVSYAALGAALATLLPPAAAGSGALVLALAGAALPALAARAAERHESLAGPISLVVAALIPDLQLFSVVEAAYGSSPPPFGYVLQLVPSVALHVAGMLAISTFILDRRELGAPRGA
jgi:hypothetical protein